MNKYWYLVKQLAVAVGVQAAATAVDETVRVKVRKFFKKGEPEKKDETETK